MLTSIVLFIVTVGLGYTILTLRKVQRHFDVLERLSVIEGGKEIAGLRLEIAILKEAIQKINTPEPKKKGGNPYPRSDEHKRKLSEAAKRRQEIRRTTIALPHIQPTGTSSDLS